MVIYIRSLKSFNEVDFCNDLEESCRQNIDFFKSVNEPVKMLLYILNNLIDQYMPLYKLSKKKPWITKGLLKSIKTRNKMFDTLCKQNFANKTLYLKYKKYKNLLTRLQDKAKINYYRHSFNVNKNDLTDAWKLINEIINQKDPSKFSCNIRHFDTSISCEKSICDILNNHIVNVGPNLANSIPSYANSCSDYFCNRINI